MNYKPFTITEKMPTVEGTNIYHLSPKGSQPLHFKAGQYVFLKNPTSSKPDEPHPFSIASSPTDPTLEFCIKTYGDWTEELEKTVTGNTLEVSEAQGSFTWDTTILHAAFLLGGIGISPIMSMLRFMRDEKIKPESLFMLYGNRTPDTVAYRDELKELQTSLPMLKIIDIYSHLPGDDPYSGYRGFITREIVEKEVNLVLQPTFFYIGPPIFIEKMDILLDQLDVPENKRRKEDFSKVNPT